jgi:hypothetical protein
MRGLSPIAHIAPAWSDHASELWDESRGYRDNGLKPFVLQPTSRIEVEQACGRGLRQDEQEYWQRSIGRAACDENERCPRAKRSQLATRAGLLVRARVSLLPSGFRRCAVLRRPPAICVRDLTLHAHRQDPIDTA